MLCLCERDGSSVSASISSTDLEPRVDLFLSVFAVIEWVAQVIAHHHEVPEPTLHRADDGWHQVLHTHTHRRDQE